MIVKNILTAIVFDRGPCAQTRRAATQSITPEVLHCLEIDIGSSFPLTIEFWLALDGVSFRFVRFNSVVQIVGELNVDTLGFLAPFSTTFKIENIVFENGV